jgi:hypothetical protein
MFVLGPTVITKDLLLNKASEEEYMAFYLGINPGKGLFTSPLRSDKNPTCSFYRNKKNELIFKDFGDGFHGNFITVVMHKYGVTYAKALNIIANDFDIVEKSNYDKNAPAVVYDGSKIDETSPSIIKCAIKEFSEKELEWWNSFGITYGTLKKFNVFSLEHVFLNGFLHSSSNEHNFIFGYYFGIKDGIEQWKIYFPFKKSYRFMGNTSILQGSKQLAKKGDFVVVTKSLKDVMAFYELGIPAIATQAESVILSPTQYKSLSKRFTHIFVNGDWDKAGMLFMQKSRKTYSCMCIAFKNKKKYGKDLTDFIKLHSFEKAIKLKDKILNFYKQGIFNYQLEYSKRNKS